MAFRILKKKSGRAKGATTADGLKIGHLNANGIVSKTKATHENGYYQDKDIRSWIQAFDVFVVSETKLADSQKATVSEKKASKKKTIDDVTPDGYTLAALENRQAGRGGGVAIYVKNCWEYNKVRQDSFNLNHKGQRIAAGKHPCQYVHVVITRKNRGGKWYKLKTAIDIVGMYIPPKALHPKETLRHLLSNIAGDPANVVVLGDVNINQFDHEHLGEFNISIWELGYGQLINKLTRGKPSTRANPREGTIIDHIYVKFPKSAKLLRSISKDYYEYRERQATDEVKRYKQTDRDSTMVDLRPKIFKSSADLLKVRVKLEEKSNKLEKKISDLILQKQAIDKQRKSLDQKIKHWIKHWSKAAESFKNMIAESDVVPKPTKSDHNLIYCTIKSEYIQLSPVKNREVIKVIE